MGVWRGSIALMALLQVGCAAAVPATPWSDGTPTAPASVVESPLAAGYEEVEFGAPEPRQLEIVDSGAHSSELVIGAEVDVVEHTRQLIVAFIEEHA